MMHKDPLWTVDITGNYNKIIPSRTPHLKPAISFEPEP